MIIHYLKINNVNKIKLFQHLILVIILFGLHSCYQSKESPSSKYTSLSGLETKWQLTMINEKSTESLLNEDLPVIIIFNSGKVNGFSGCNNFSGTYSKTETEIKTSSLVSTRKMCENMDLEDQFLKALSNNTLNFKIESENLHLVGKENVKFKFIKQQ